MLIAFFASLSPIAGSAPFLGEPDIFGETAVFTREVDLWLGDVSTGKATRLTLHEGRRQPWGRFLIPSWPRVTFERKQEPRECRATEAMGGPY